MPDTMMDPAFWIVVFILMGIIWLQQRLVRKDGFKAGAALGIVFGIKQATTLLTTGKYSVQSEDGATVYNNEALINDLVAAVMKTLSEQTTKQFE